MTRLVLAILGALSMKIGSAHAQDVKAITYASEYLPSSAPLSCSVFASPPTGKNFKNSAVEGWGRYGSKHENIQTSTTSTAGVFLPIGCQLRPQDLKAESIWNTGAVISWSPIPESDRRWYSGEVWNSKTGTWAPILEQGNPELSSNIQRLSFPDSQGEVLGVKWRVRTACRAGGISETSSAGFYAPDCFTPKALSVVSAATTAELSWGQVTGASHYTVQVNGPGGASTYNTSSESLKLTLTRLYPGTPYSWSISAYCKGIVPGESGFVSGPSFTTDKSSDCLPCHEADATVLKRPSPH